MLSAACYRERRTVETTAGREAVAGREASLEGQLLEDGRAFRAEGMGSVEALRQQQTSVTLKDREAATMAEGELLGVRWVSQRRLSGWAPPELPRTWGVPQTDKPGFKAESRHGTGTGQSGL